MLAKKKEEEKYLSLCFAILAEYLSVGSPEMAPPPSLLEACPSEVVEQLSLSSLLPALASSLLNDSS